LSFGRQGIAMYRPSKNRARAGLMKCNRIRVIVGAKINTKVATMDVPEPVIELAHALVRESASR
jgi:hypothetical protein